MEIVIKLSQFLLSLSLLIVLHELGHFIPAKLFKTRVEKFYLFFDVKFSLLKKKIGETEYGIGWLPLGGYVKIAGMIDESMDKEQMMEEPKPWEFRSKPGWQRLIIMLGGVTVNFILAFIIYIGIAYAYGDTYLSNQELKDGILVTGVGQQIGLQTGDKILEVDGEKMERFNEIPGKMLFAKYILIERAGEQKKIEMPIDFLDQLMDKRKERFISLRMPFVIGMVTDSSSNKEVLKPRDIIKTIEEQKIKYADEAIAIFESKKGQKISATLFRDEKEIPVTLTINEQGKLGVFQAGLDIKSLERLGIYKFDTQKYTFLEAIPAGVLKGKDQLVDYGKQLKAIVNPQTGAYKGMGGFYSIFNIFPDQWDWENFWNITAILSLMLGVMNLLPIPALDGGHVMFLLYEMIVGKKPSDLFLERAQIIGFSILIALVFFVNGNDIYRAILGK